jgi:hypothetical protein
VYLQFSIRRLPNVCRCAAALTHWLEDHPHRRSSSKRIRSESAERQRRKHGKTPAEAVGHERLVRELSGYERRKPVALSVRRQTFHTLDDHPDCVAVWKRDDADCDRLRSSGGPSLDDCARRGKPRWLPRRSCQAHDTNMRLLWVDRGAHCADARKSCKANRLGAEVRFTPAELAS